MSMVADKTTTKNVLDEIVQWSAKLPDWQSDGLRRIVLKCDLQQKDVEELTELCKAEHELVDDLEAPKAVPLSDKDVPTGTRSGAAVALVAIGSPEHVNAICDKQRLEFAPSGLTVIFGYNGSGKTGYGRILKRACRSRAPGEPIKANVLDASDTGPASAEITFAIGGKEQAPEQWIDGIRKIDQLAAVSFFDADCAQVHVASRNDIAFTPFGLDILPKLGAACKAVQKALTTAQDSLQAQTPKFLRENKTRTDTAVGKLLRNLSATTDAAGVEQLASMSDADKDRLTALRSELASDPRKGAMELRARAARLKSLTNLLRSWEAGIADNRVATVRSVKDTAAAKAAAAFVAAKGAFDGEPLSDVGGPVWRQLWEAARRYSTEHAYVGQPFPVVGEDARCVLCQQELGSDARERFTRFEDFIRDDTAKQSRTAAAEFDHELATIEQVAADRQRLSELLPDVAIVDEHLVQPTRQCAASILRRRRKVLKACGDGQWQDISNVSEMHVCDDLSKRSTLLETQALALESTLDPTKRHALELELAELEDRQWLETVVGDVKDELERLNDLAAYKKAIDSTKTNTITAKSKQLAKDHVTDRLRDAFAKELRHMHQGIRRLEVELAATSAEYGSSQYRVQLVGASKADIDDVVSEGEHRCVALAGFLAELSTEHSRSAIVFDDPVTSLDHLWRECFARRIVDEAGHRQVVVFTHDIVFLHDLLDHARRNNIPYRPLRVHAERERTGLISDSLPWIAVRVQDRIDKLEKECRAVRTLYDKGDDDGYEAAIGTLYSRLRATVERTIEDKFFGNVVLRHRDFIDLKGLGRVAVVTTIDCDRIQRLHKTCCDVTEAHDRASLRSFGVPHPNDAMKAVNELSAIIADLQARITVAGIT